MVRFIRNDELYHYGRSIKDGAPGVGTGNWRRGGGRTRSQSAVRQEYYRVRKKERSGIYDKSKYQGSYHYLNKLDHEWQEVINAREFDEPINVAGQIAKNENFLKRVSPDETFDRTREVVNMYYGAPGTTNNCKKCTAAQEIRRRGWDVVAGRSFGGGRAAATSYWFDGAVQYVEDNLDKFYDLIPSVFGNNGRGEITFSYPNGGAHSVYAYRDKSGYTISDGQSNDKFVGNSWQEAMKKAEEYYGLRADTSYYTYGQYTCTRLDTATPNWKHLEQDSVLRCDYVKDSLNQIRNVKTGKYGMMVDTRKNDVSRAAYEAQIRSGEDDNIYGYTWRTNPWESGNDYFRIPYKRG